MISYKDFKEKLGIKCTCESERQTDAAHSPLCDLNLASQVYKEEKLNEIRRKFYNWQSSELKKQMANYHPFRVRE